MTDEATIVYTDGACQGNPGPGGWAWAVPGGRFASGPAARRQAPRHGVYFFFLGGGGAHGGDHLVSCQLLHHARIIINAQICAG